MRPATHADRFAIVRMARDFHAASGLPFQFDPAYAERTTLDVMARGCVLVLDDLTGVIAGTIDLHPCWPVTVATDVIWWVDPGSRGKGLTLLRGFEKWAKANDADVIGVKALADEAGPILSRCGYARGDTSYFRVL